MDRGRGWVDRGRGQWVERGRGVPMERGGGGLANRGRGRANIEFDKSGEFMWDDKNSCWKKVPQHWKVRLHFACTLLKYKCTLVYSLKYTCTLFTLNTLKCTYTVFALCTLKYTCTVFALCEYKIHVHCTCIL